MNRWIELDGAANVRDLGGLPTRANGTTRFGRVFRSDNLQGLSPADVTRLVGDLGLRHVIDLRSVAELHLEGPGPLTRRPEVAIHHHSLFVEDPEDAPGSADGEPEADIERILPWMKRQDDPDAPVTQRAVAHYLDYLAARPDSVVAALRVMAYQDGAAIVHCAAGKDRTGVIVALALEVAGVEREHIVDDYVRTGERIAKIMARLQAKRTYATDLSRQTIDSHIPQAAVMEGFLATLDSSHGGPAGWLDEHGWTGGDTAALHERLTA